MEYRTIIKSDKEFYVPIQMKTSMQFNNLDPNGMQFGLVSSNNNKEN